MKGKEIDEEIETIKPKIGQYGLSLNIEKYTLPYLGLERSIVVLSN